jgi:hypothetical protein
LIGSLMGSTIRYIVDRIIEKNTDSINYKSSFD